MGKQLTGALMGTMGHFWLDLAEYSRIDSSWPGHASRSGSRYVVRVIKKPAEMSDFPDAMDDPEAIFGITEYGGLVAWDVVRSAENLTGGTTISVRSFSAGAIGVGIDSRDLASAGVSSITARFFGLGSWSGLTGGETDHEYHDNGTLKSFGYKTKSIPEMRAPLDRRTSIALGVTWSSTERQLDQLTVLTPHEFTVRAGTGRLPILRCLRTRVVFKTF